MSTPLGTEKLGELEFKWGKKKGIGGKNKDIKFYMDFTYDGIDYKLYDRVYLYKEGEPAPYIGKLVKIWENNDKSKKIKVQWFFRPSEISFHLQDAESLENELFLASGDGKGLANINSLEAIAGKCNVVCISKDSRNPQPSTEELETIDYVFYRLFDVKSCTVSDRMDDYVGGLEVKYVFNRGDNIKTYAVPNLNPRGKEASQVAGSAALRLLDNVKPEEKENSMLGNEGEKVMEATMQNGNLPGESHEVYVNAIDIKKVHDISIEKKVVLDYKIVGDKGRSENDKSKDVKSLDIQVKMEERVKPLRNPDDLDATRSTKKARLDLQGKQSKDSVGTERCKKLGENSSVQIERPSTMDAVLLKETPRSGSNKDLQGSGQAFSAVKNTNVSPKMPLKRSIEMFKAGNAQNDKDVGLAKDSCPLGGSSTKKGRSLENSNIKVGKPPGNNLPSSTCDGADGKVVSRTFEVTRRPVIEKSNWMKLNWEDKMKNAHDHGRLLLLQNLDPTYTSGEVEDIVWHAFKEECTAKMLQHTAISNPYSGQALVILKSREAAGKVLKKLDNGCLMLSNKRSLVARHVDFPKFLEKQTTFVGHLAMDRARRQIQRELKEAVATSHYSQNNTIEYEMAMSWCLLQLKCDEWWKKLYEQQRKEVEKLTSNLKSK